MSGGFSHNQLITIFERIACVTPPKQYYSSIAFPQAKLNTASVTRQMRAFLVECLKTQKIIKFQADLKQLCELHCKIAEVHVFKAEIEIALMKPEVALETMNEGLRQKAEPQELLRDVHFVLSSYLNKARNTHIKPVILRKPKNDPYSQTYKVNTRRMDEVELLLQYIVGGPAIFDELPEEVVIQQNTKQQGQKQTTQNVQQNKTQNVVQNQQQNVIQKNTIQQQTVSRQQPQQSSFETQLQQKKSQQINQIQNTKQSAYQEENVVINQLKQQEAEQQAVKEPSNQLLEYMKKKNIVKRSAAPEQAQQNQSQVEKSQNINYNVNEVIDDVKKQLNMDEVDQLRNQEIGNQIKLNIIEQPVLMKQELDIDDQEVIVSTTNINIIQRNNEMKDDIKNEIQNIQEFEELDLHNSMNNQQVDVIQNDDFDEQEDEEAWGFKEEMIKSIQNIKKNKDQIQPETQSVFDADQSGVDYLNK